MDLLSAFRSPEAEPPPVAPHPDQRASSRRDRAARAGSDMLLDGLGQKVLHGWLQNRHQTLVPLTLNLRVLSEPQRALVAAASAALLLAGRPREDALAAAADSRRWLQDLGADPAALAIFDQALRAPPSFDQIVERTLELDVAAYTYLAALTAADPRFKAGAILCDALQARFELPTAIVRSITRRHHR